MTSEEPKDSLKRQPVIIITLIITLLGFITGKLPLTSVARTIVLFMNSSCYSTQENLRVFKQEVV